MVFSALVPLAVATPVPRLKSMLDDRERQDVQGWVAAAAKQHPGHWQARHSHAGPTVFKIPATALQQAVGNDTAHLTAEPTSYCAASCMLLAGRWA